MIILFIWQTFGSESTLTIIVSNVKVGEGTIFTSVWADEKSFFKKPFLTQSLNADHDSLRFIFRLQPGKYGVSIFQDLNNNKKLDQGLFGIPREPVGFGNNFRPKFSAPTFEDCAFKIDTNLTMTISIK